MLFCSLFLPIVTMAGQVLRDGCIENGKYKSEFTIDRRCYVTDEQKKQAPYNATVAVLDDAELIGCTGTIVRDNQDFLLEDAFKYETKLPVPGLFVYTAAHCLTQNNKIQMQNGEFLNVWLTNFDKKEDWAVFQVLEENNLNMLPYVDIAYGESPENQLKVIGYGALAIMSDKDIRDYKKTYIDFLKTKYPEKEIGQFFVDDSIVKWDYAFFDEYPRLPEDDETRLKESVCHINSEDDFCQVWFNNSGGGIFVNDKLFAIISRAALTFGGKHHAAFLKDVKTRWQDKGEYMNNAIFLQNSQQDNLERLRE